MPTLDVLNLLDRLTPYMEGWDEQRRLHDAVVDGSRDNVLMLVEHEPVYTAGKRTQPEDRPTDGSPVIDVDRGGRITWHGPGQLVGYPLVRMPDPIDVMDYVHRLEAAVMRVCATYGIATERQHERTFVGVFDLIGTIASGWLTDRVNPRYLLIAYYGLRGLALLSVPVVLGPGIEWPLLFFIVFYGLDWVATVPPTVQLCREAFGLERSGILYGWVFASHMVGAGVAASFSGWIRQTQGDYSIAWFVAAALALAASASIIFIPKGRAKSFAQAS